MPSDPVEQLSEADSSSPTPLSGQRPSRRWRTGAVLVIGVLIGATFSGVGAVWASHQFSDVPNSNPFHDDIAWMADNNIAGGFDDGTYRPTDPVSRQAFAAFLRRYNANFEFVSRTLSFTAAGTWWSVDAWCPPGMRAIAGGGMAFTPDVAILRTSGAGKDFWTVQWVSRTGDPIAPGALTAEATCIPNP